MNCGISATSAGHEVRALLQASAGLGHGRPGTTIWRGNFNKLVDWRRTVASIGASELHFHDLRHTGNTLAARTGTSLRDLMTRMGHENPRAALIYQHAIAEADLAIAAAINVMVEAATGEYAKAEGSTKAGSDNDSSKDAEDGAGALGLG